VNGNRFQIEAAVARWTGRLLGIALVVLVATLAIGEGLPNPLTQPVNVQLGLLGLALMVGGILVAWFRELPGGIISLAGWATFVLSVMHSPRGLNWFVLAMALPGILCVVSALLRHYFIIRQQGQ
jgi:hypothetical protein